MAIDFAKLTLQDALDLAILIEDEARDRYADFTRLVGGRYRGDAADVFLTMAQNEAKHGLQLAERRRQLFGDAPRRIGREQLDDVEAPDQGKPRVFMSPRQAMEVAIESEAKAEEFYREAQRTVKDPEVRKLFEELRREEVEHQKLLRARLGAFPAGPDLEEADADAPGSDAG
jgi:erythrin-vacuolar iron transport family protein